MYLLTGAAAVRTLVDSFCSTDLAADIVTGDQIALDVARYLRDVPIPSPPVRFAPSPLALVNIPTYFQAPIPAVAPAAFGGRGVIVTITVLPTTYHWDFGADPDRTLDTSSPGVAPTGDNPFIPPPDAVTHTYTTSSRYTATLAVDWHATYTVTVAGIVLGPYDVTDPVTPPATRIDVPVAEAPAELIGGSG